MDGKVLDTLFSVKRIWRRYTATSNVIRTCSSDRYSLRFGFFYLDLFERSVPTARHSRAGHCRTRAADALPAHAEPGKTLLMQRSGSCVNSKRTAICGLLAVVSNTAQRFQPLKNI